MTSIHVWNKFSPTPLIYDNVEMYFEKRKTLEIVQEEAYTTTTTVVMKDSITHYTIIEKR